MVRRHLAAILDNIETKVESSLIDQDSGDFGTVAYKLEDDQSGLFAIDAQTGIVRTTGNLATISNLKLPFRLKVTAIDNPNGVKYEQNSVYSRQK